MKSLKAIVFGAALLASSGVMTLVAAAKDVTVGVSWSNFQEERWKTDEAAIKGALAATPIKGRITLSGYEGSELLVGRLLVESGADLRYVGTACPRTRFAEADAQWLEAHGVEVRFRASLEHQAASMPVNVIARRMNG